MGKSKSKGKQGGSSSSDKKSASSAAKKCACDHPYRCSCGNRPERPSKGHKWDPLAQAWGGKGHKQRGASGQAAVAGVEAVVTSAGNTSLKQWQKLPSRLLADLVRKNGKSLGRGTPIYRPVNNGNKGKAAAGGYRYRVIIPDDSKNRSRDNDVVLTPTLPVANDEQAREEAALLGLLHLFRELPHERTLPEPYRSTYLAALENARGGGVGDGDGAGRGRGGGAAGRGGKGDGSAPAKKRGDATTSGDGGGGAAANARLVADLPSFHLGGGKGRGDNNGGDGGGSGGGGKVVNGGSGPPLLTKAQVDEARKAHRREVQARIRKHEAVRNANRPMEVFMSARFRRRIEGLLRGGGGGGGALDDDDDDDGEHEEELRGGDDDDDEVEDGVLCYVHRRLVREGFASTQVRRAYREVVKKDPSLSLGRGGGEGDDAQSGRMDRAYEETLQHLCAHLPEDRLPTGFDPRGGTLDVVRPGRSASSTGGADGTDAIAERRDGAPALRLAERFGLAPGEARAVVASYSSSSLDGGDADEDDDDDDMSSAVERAFWTALCDAASLPVERTCRDAAVDDDGERAASKEEDRQRNEEAASNECEALSAIFEGGQFVMRNEGGMTRLSIALPSSDGAPRLKRYLEVHYRNGAYPDMLPMVFVTNGSRSNDDGVGRDSNWGGRIHMKLMKYMSEMSPGQEVVFDLYGHVTALLEEEATAVSKSEGSLSELLVALKLENGANNTQQKMGTGSQEDYLDTDASSNDAGSFAQRQDQTAKKRQRTPQRRRPQTGRGRQPSFWNTHPSKTPPAEPFPKLTMSLERARKSLPAAKAKGDFLSLLARANGVGGGRVVLVTGETGCGKTTQIPQFILEDSPRESKIIVAQPRRLAATGVASRVALERGESSPGVASVGYAVRGDSKMCASTRLMFCTTGVLLRQLQSRSALENFSHVVIDEVHERHLDTDVLLAILKKTLPSFPKLTVVLMSATMDADRFASYWGGDCPRMHIPGFTHPVKDFNLEDVLQLTNYIPPKKKKKRQQYSGGGASNYQTQQQSFSVDDDDDFGKGEEEEEDTDAIPVATECSVPLEERLKRISETEIDYDLIAILIKSLLQSKEDDGSILVFLPGAGEIERAERALNQTLNRFPLTILALHGGLQPEKQQQVFLPAKMGTKIILSTNVAETSITIPDCTIVVDSCKEKQSSFDPVNRMPLLLEQFASQDSLKQRRGRAGRVRPGTCYKLISRAKFERLPEHGEPEIRRCALDQTILSLIYLGLEDGSGDFLRTLLDPPSRQSIRSAIDSLEKVGALYKDGNLAYLTPLGSHLAGIPAPPTVGKLLVMGTLLGCRNIAVSIAATMSAGRSPFLRIKSPFNGKQQHAHQCERDAADSKILEERNRLFKLVGNSDHAMLGKAFLLWKDCQGASERKNFCFKLGLAFNSMREILALTKQLDSSLTALGFLPSKDCLRNESSWRIVRSMIVASLSPTQIVRVQRPSAKYTETVEGAVEKDGKAKELKFFIRGGSDCPGSSRTSNEERVFVHPSSNNFSVGSYSCPWLVYHRLVRTSKAFISDATECNPYSLLLFGGSMEVKASEGLIVLDDWIKLAANARIGSLIRAMREKVDELLERKVADPSLEISGTAEMKLITDLIKHDGI